MAIFPWESSCIASQCAIRVTDTGQAYAISNPENWKDYGEHVWGLTACDGPANVQREYKGKLRNFYGYQGRGLVRLDDGTVSPPAVVAIRTRDRRADTE